MAEKIQQYHVSVKKAREELSKSIHSQFGSLATSGLSSVDWTIKSIKLCKEGPYGGENKRINGRRLYDITFAMKKHKERKGHPFRSLLEEHGIS